MVCYLFLSGLFFGKSNGSPPNGLHDASIAFYITVSIAELPHLRRLIDRVYHPGNIYLIEYHSSIPESSFEIFPRAQNIFQRHSDAFVPSGVTYVLNVLDGMAFFFNREESLLSHSDGASTPVSFDYFIPLSPTSYPTISAQNMRTLLSLDEPSPNFFHFGHASQMPLFDEDINTIYVDLALSFNASAPPSLYTRHHGHPEKSRRKFSLPRASPFFVASRAFAKFAVDSITSKRLLLVLAETANVADRFFASLIEAAPPTIGPVIRTASLHCVHSDALDKHVNKTLPNYSPRPPSVAFLQTVSKPCLFTSPFTEGPFLALRDQIDKFILTPPGTQGRPPGTSYYVKVKAKLDSLVASL